MTTASQLLTSIPAFRWEGGLDPIITHITEDSRTVQPGSLFVARSGGSRDGNRFIPQAIARGAVGIVGENPLPDLPIPYWRVSDAAAALAWLSAAWHGFPSQSLTLLGVTGTDGKTTTSNYLYQILQAAGVRVGLISTVNAVIGDKVLDTGLHVTTPTAPELQGYLAQMVAAGLTHCVLEVTSHGLTQHRLTGCDFNVAVLTNITHEHLDYHGSQEAYRAAKTSLFTGLGTDARKRAILNADDESYAFVRAQTQVPVVSYGREGTDLHVSQILPNRESPYPVQYVADINGREWIFQSRLRGIFNIWNSLAAVGAAHFGIGIDLDVCQRGIASLAGVAGRMEPLNAGQDFWALVDFAHTPNALHAALQAARQITSGKIIAVFGAAGLRDRSKRALMAAIAARHADIAIFTAEDPRTESLDAILQEMATACQDSGGVEGKTFWRIPDRFRALRFATQLARTGDLVIACGKAHEQSLCFGEVEYPWDERTALRAAILSRQESLAPSPFPLPTA